MELETRMTMLIGAKGMTIEIRCHKSGITFFEAEVPPEQTLAMIGRLGAVEVHANVMHLERVGKELEHKRFEFKLPEDADCSENREEIASKIVAKVCPKGWVPDLYFGSRGSFFTRNGVSMAQTTIRRWK